MTKVQIYQTQNAENRIYFLGSLIGSCVVGIPLGFLICNKIAEIPGLSYISYQFPWLFLLLYFVLRPRSGSLSTGTMEDRGAPIPLCSFKRVIPFNIPFTVCAAALGLSKSSAMYCLISTKSCRASSEMCSLFIHARIYFVKAMCWRRTAVSRAFSQIGLQTLACMKSTCNGPSPMTASRRFVFIGFLLPRWVPPHGAAGHRPAHDVHGMAWRFCAGAFLQGLPS